MNILNYKEQIKELYYTKTIIYRILYLIFAIICILVAINLFSIVPENTRIIGLIFMIAALFVGNETLQQRAISIVLGYGGLLLCFLELGLYFLRGV